MGVGEHVYFSKGIQENIKDFQWFQGGSMEFWGIAGQITGTFWKNRFNGTIP